MQTELEKIVFSSIDALIHHATSEKKLKEIHKKHEVKVHFVPIKYRILGGILQSMNIQFGNFIEELM